MISTQNIVSEFSEKLKYYQEVFTAHDWDIKSNFPFCYFINRKISLPNQGWKIHVSCLAKEAPQILDKLLPVLINEDVSFKIASSTEDILRFNSGEYGNSQIGKIVTVYPKDTDHAYSLGQRIDKIWNTSTAPGPPSDLYFRPGGNVSLRFGAINNEKTIVHHDNAIYPALIHPNGNLVPDISHLDGQQADWAPALPGGLQTNCYFGREHELLKQATNERYLIVYPLLKKTFTATFLCMDMELMRPVLMKVYYKRSDETQDGNSVIDAGRTELAIATYLSMCGLSPDVLATYEDEYFLYVAWEYIVGDNFAALPKGKRISLLPLLLENIQKMHDAGIVHRDLKLANIMVRNDQLYFIDFELSVFAGKTKPTRSGTKNYIPPEGAQTEAHSSYDCFSLGSCLIHAYVGVDAAALPPDPQTRLDAVTAYIPQRTYNLIKALYHTDPASRPSAAEGIAEICYPQGKTVFVCPENMKIADLKTERLIDHGLLAMERLAIPADDTIRWNSQHKSGAVHMNWGLNTGMGGKVLGLLSLVQTTGGKTKDSALGMAERSLNYILQLPASQIEDITPGLFTGLAGSALALGAAYQALGSAHYADKSYELLEAATKQALDYDLFNGHAGIAYTAIKLFAETEQERFMHIAERSMDILLSGKDNIDGITAWKVNSQEQTPRYETGAAHGTSGIAMVIALYGTIRKSQEHIAMAIKCYKEIFAHARYEDRNCICRDIGVKMRHPGPNTIWCHGAAGYLWAMLQVPELYDALSEEIKWTISVCAGQSHISNPTYCHGMAGSLELWRMANQTIFRSETTEIMYENTLFELVNISQEQDGLRLFASEDASAFSPDLWVGYLGSICSLALAKAHSNASILNIKW